MRMICDLPASEHSAHHAADHAKWSARATGIANTTSATVPMVVGFAGLRRYDAFVQQRLLLLRVEVGGLGIVVFLLPARDGAAGRIVELSADLSVEPELAQPALNFATRCLGQTDLIFGFQSCFVGGVAVSMDADTSRGAVLRPALAALALAKTPRTATAKIRTRMASCS